MQKGPPWIQIGHAHNLLKGQSLMKAGHCLGFCTAFMLARCAVEAPVAPPHVNQEQVMTLGAGQRVILTGGQRAKIPSGFTVTQPGGSELINRGHGNTVSVNAGAVVSVPVDATGSADNLIIVASAPSGGAAMAAAATSAPRQGQWLPESSGFQPNWRRVEESLYVNLGNDSEAVARLAGSYYAEDVPEIPASKSLSCGSGYKKFLMRSFYADNPAITVFATQHGLVVGTTSLARPPLSSGAIAICLKSPPERVEGMFTQLWLPL